ncbi:hypothetical protein GCM10010987_64960 [Bradyrhizobium guangdongense]|uniref:Uncharacterized protein n=1 Tax=Bradyrhizobium guangdongense TaxID=1325090 RepID=A0AA88BBJ2_9BRAD|nr:hypothetical protein GCM10010987_64960 [Bradyrhizobium guangdongense]
MWCAWSVLLAVRWSGRVNQPCKRMDVKCETSVARTERRAIRAKRSIVIPGRAKREPDEGELEAGAVATYPLVASAAKQSRVFPGRILDCFAALAMTSGGSMHRISLS